MLLIDTYNLLHAWRNSPLEENGADVAALARLLGASGYASGPIQLICDGTPPSGHDGQHDFQEGIVRITYAGVGKDADSLIEAIIERSSAPTRLLVVSSDRRIQRAAKRRRAYAIQSQRFIALLVNDARNSAVPAAEKPGSVEPEDVSAWLGYFSLPAGERQVSPSPEGSGATDTQTGQGVADPDELDMSRWVEGIQRLSPPEPPVH